MINNNNLQVHRKHRITAHMSKIEENGGRGPFRLVIEGPVRQALEDPDRYV